MPSGAPTFDAIGSRHGLEPHRSVHKPVDNMGERRDKIGTRNDHAVMV
jgi:hypothetical protein